MKYKNLYLMIWLISIWSLFFALYKYFIWWIFKNDTITLQFLSWYLSIGTLLAFIVWWIFYELLKEKIYHFLVWLLTIITIISIFFIPWNYIVVWWITLLVWIFYGLWTVLRWILVSNEIENSNLWDTKVNWLANIFFIVSIIIWSIIWWIIAEKLDINWLYIIWWIIIIWIILWFFLKYKHSDINKTKKEKIIEYKNNYISDFKFILKKYFLIMFSASSLITIATILSQKAIEYNVNILQIKQSSASMILLYSAIWTIIWNIISMKIKKDRWLYFMIFCFLFWISTILFPLFINNFLFISILSFIAWIMFWITYNLVDSYFYKKIADDNKKSFWRASIWIVASITVAFVMFFVDYLQNIVWFNWVYYFMAIFIILLWIILFYKRKTFNT